MPSRTADGKRLSGAQQQKLKLHRAATVVDATRQQLETAIEVVDKAIVDAAPSPLRKLPPPPIDDGVEAVGEWLVSVLVMCGRSLQRNLEPARASVACELARYMMGLSGRAAEAEAIDTLRRLHDHTHVPVQLDADEPPNDPVYLH